MAITKEVVRESFLDDKYGTTDLVAAAIPLVELMASYSVAEVIRAIIETVPCLPPEKVTELIVTLCEAQEPEQITALIRKLRKQDRQVQSQDELSATKIVREGICFLFDKSSIEYQEISVHLMPAEALLLHYLLQNETQFCKYTDIMNFMIKIKNEATMEKDTLLAIVSRLRTSLREFNLQLAQKEGSSVGSIVLEIETRRSTKHKTNLGGITFRIKTT